MILLKDIKGQTNAVTFLTRSISAKRVASSYLFTGPSGTGRASCAKALAASLMCEDAEGEEACGICPSCRRIDALEHPDLLWVKPEKTKFISIDEVRGVKDKLSLKPYEARLSVCVIEDAHMMKDVAANALLKMLEEPPGDSVTILITDKKELLLDTVISRCSEVRFSFLPIKDTVRILKEQSDVSEDTATLLAHFSQGSPGRALELAEDGIEEERNRLYGYLSEIAEERNIISLAWKEDKKDILIEDIDMLVMIFRDIAMANTGIEDKMLDRQFAKSVAYQGFKGYSADRIYRIINELIEMKWALLGNVNAKFVAQALPARIKG